MSEYGNDSDLMALSNAILLFSQNMGLNATNVWSMLYDMNLKTSENCYENMAAFVFHFGNGNYSRIFVSLLLY